MQIQYHAAFVPTTPGEYTHEGMIVTMVNFRLLTSIVLVLASIPTMLLPGPTARSTAYSEDPSTAEPYSPVSIEELGDEPIEYRDVPPIVPNLAGNGTNTFAGSGRNLRPPSSNILRITRLDDSGRGSLRDCIDRTGPRTCLFEVGGEIVLRSALRIRER